jgi:hypothetical protein
MTLIEFSAALSNLSPFISGLGLLLGCLTYKRLNGLHQCLTIYLGIMLFTHLLAELLGHVISDNNLIVLHIYSFLELIILLYLYKKHLFKSRQLILTGLGLAGLLYIITEMLLLFVFNTLNVRQHQPYAKVVGNFVIVLMALAFMYEKMSRFREIEWGNFRLNIVFLIFFTLETVLFLPFNFMVNEESGIKFYFWTGHVIAIILFYMYLTFKIWRNGRTPRL